jgi:putative hemolysin
VEDVAVEELYIPESGRVRRPRFITAIALSQAEVREAQRLRYRVFVEEMGASISSANERLDRDEFDPYCEHLLVRNCQSGRVVGTYRILSAAQSLRAGGFYSEREFHLDGLAGLKARMIEIGRACVDPDYRSGAVIATLWSGLAHYLWRSGHDYVIGCASVATNDGGRLATSIYHSIQREYASPLGWRVRPRCQFPLGNGPIYADPQIPPLLKGYLRLGAYVCGEPAWDAKFNTADLLLMLPLVRMNPRYVNRFERQW